ncbi:MAG: O-antigen polymerase [Fusobacteriaceae bacterium]
MLNPFYLYSLIWLLVIIIYNFGWSGIYPKLTLETYVFFILTISLSFIIGFMLRKKYKICIRENKVERIFVPILIIVLGHVLQFIYVGKIPLIEQLRKTGYMYIDFSGIPTFHVLLLTFNAYYSVYLSLLFFRLKKAKYLLGYFLSIFMIMLLYNRGMIIMILFMSFIIFLSLTKITKKKILSSFIFGILILYIFGILGNLRHGYKWDDTSYLGEIGKIEKDLGKLNPFFWSYIYISSPLANLQYNIDNTEPIYSIDNLILVNTIPDFIKKRTTIKQSQGKLIVQNLNVSTAFLSQYLEGGLIGMYLLYFIFIGFNIFYSFLFESKDNYFVVGISIVCCVVTFSFFVNMYIFSGLSFQLIYPLILGNFSKLNFRIKRIKKVF